MWINVAHPPEGAPPPGIKGKTVDISPEQLRRRKIDALQLALVFSFAVKHYLREEDGLHHADYTGILPTSMSRYDETGYNTSMNASTFTYSATTNNSKRDSVDVNANAATKRVRNKRSKTPISGSTTPLLGNTHSIVEFHHVAEHGSMPLPLV